MPDCCDLSAEHDGGEEGKEESLEHEKEEEYHGGGGRVGLALLELRPHAGDGVADGQVQRVVRHHSDIQLKQTKVAFKSDRIDHLAPLIFPLLLMFKGLVVWLCQVVVTECQT